VSATFSSKLSFHLLQSIAQSHIQDLTLVMTLSDFHPQLFPSTNKMARKLQSQRTISRMRRIELTELRAKAGRAKGKDSITSLYCETQKGPFKRVMLSERQQVKLERQSLGLVNYPQAWGPNSKTTCVCGANNTILRVHLKCMHLSTGRESLLQDLELLVTKIGAPTRWDKWTSEGKIKASITPTRIFTKISDNNRFYTRALSLWAKLTETAKDINIPEEAHEREETPEQRKKRKQDQILRPNSAHTAAIALLSQKKRRTLRQERE
jgi:hypothetical protein